MKIGLFKFYRNGIIVFWTIATIVIVSSIIMTINFGVEDKGGFLFLLLGFLLGIFCIVFPVLLNYRQLTYVIFEKHRFSAYSLAHKKLCSVELDQNVFFAEFFVQFALASRVKFIALSNAPFIVNQPQSIFDKNFYGSYDQTKILIFPYDEQVIPYLHFELWNKCR